MDVSLKSATPESLLLFSFFLLWGSLVLSKVAVL